MFILVRIQFKAPKNSSIDSYEGDFSELLFWLEKHFNNFLQIKIRNSERELQTEIK